MKYILNERFVLSEKFILNEASSKDEASILLNTLNMPPYTKDYLVNIIDELKLRSSNNKLATQLKQKSEMISNIQKTGAGKDAIKNAINEYLKIFNDYFSVEMLNKNNTIKTYVTDLQASIDNENTAVDNIISAFNLLDTATNKLLTIDEKDNIILIDTLAQFVKNIETVKDYLTRFINADSLEETTEINQTLASANKAVSSKTDYSVADTEALLKNVQEDNKALADVAKILKDTNVIRSKTAKETDWAELLKNARDNIERKAIWEQYFKVVWGNQADKVKALGSSFINQLNYIGFSEKVNPFVKFVTEHIVGGELLTINDNAYGGLNNAYVRKYITKADLINPDAIIVCQDLYNKTGSEVLELLRLRLDAKSKIVDQKIDNRNNYALYSLFQDDVNEFNMTQTTVTKIKSMSRLTEMFVEKLGDLEKTLPALDIADLKITSVDEAKCAIISLAVWTGKLNVDDVWTFLKNRYGIDETFVKEKYNMLTDRYQKIWKKVDISSGNIIGKMDGIAKSQGIEIKEI